MGKAPTHASHWLFLVGFDMTMACGTCTEASCKKHKVVPPGAFSLDKALFGAHRTKQAAGCAWCRAKREPF